MHKVTVVRVFLASVVAFVVLCCFSAASGVGAYAAITVLLAVVIVTCGYHVMQDNAKVPARTAQAKSNEANLAVQAPVEEAATVVKLEVRPHSGVAAAVGSDEARPQQQPATDATPQPSPEPSLHPYNPTVQSRLKTKLLMERQAEPTAKEFASMRDKFTASLASDIEKQDDYVRTVADETQPAAVGLGAGGQAPESGP